MADRPKRSLKHSLISGLIVLSILWITRGYWSGQGLLYLVIAALISGVMAEYATKHILRFMAPPKDPEE